LAQAIFTRAALGSKPSWPTSDHHCSQAPMSLRLQRVALAAAFVGASASAANLAEDCRSGLQLLQGQSDFELAASCRASFAPEVCRQAGRTLGDQPWSSEHMDESCARFAAAYSGTDARGLESAVSRKAATLPKPTPLEEATSQKKHPTGGAIPTPATKQPTEGKSSPGGLIRHLLDKVRDGKTAEEGEEAKEAKEVEDRTDGVEPPNDLESEVKSGLQMTRASRMVESKVETAEEPTDLQKEAKVAAELDTKAATQREMMAPMSKKAATEIESLKSDVKPDLKVVAEKAESEVDKVHPLEKTETDGAVELFGQLGLQPEQEGSPRDSLLPGLVLFTASAAFVTLAVLRRRRTAFGREAFLGDLEQDASSISPILE